MKNTNQYRTIFHRDGSITVWNCLTGNWHRTSNPSDALLATLREPERSRVMRHCGIVLFPKIVQTTLDTDR